MQAEAIHPAKDACAFSDEHLQVARFRYWRLLAMVASETNKLAAKLTIETASLSTLRSEPQENSIRRSGGSWNKRMGLL